MGGLVPGSVVGVFCWSVSVVFDGSMVGVCSVDGVGKVRSVIVGGLLFDAVCLIVGVRV